MANEDDLMQAPESRSSAFASGQTGSMEGMHVATATPSPRPAERAFNPASSVLMAANRYSGVLNASSEGTLRISNPYGLAMKETLTRNNGMLNEQE